MGNKPDVPGLASETWGFSNGVYFRFTTLLSGNLSDEPPTMIV